jgi:LPS sulfotransferase NodH
VKSPVFVVGCPRSGTTLLYSMLVAAGGFAVYRKETYFYSLVSRFPSMRTPRDQERFTTEYLQGYLGKVPGFDVVPFVRNAARQCATPADFLPRLMEGIARSQRVERWIEATPVHLLFMPEIKKAVPDARFVHVIRDGRDCALSYERQRWVTTLPWDRRRSVGVAALFWDWTVRTGRRLARTCGDDYLEIHFEDLVADPPAVLARIGRFLDHDLDYERIQRNPVHALRIPNTSFRDDRSQGAFNPVERWKTPGASEDARLCETLIGQSLEELGYPLAFPRARGTRRLRARTMRWIYQSHYAGKHWIKTRTTLGRYAISTRVWAEQPRKGEKAMQDLLIC